jgi:hypothetical protein
MLYNILTYLVTELTPSWGAANCAATQYIPSILWNRNVHYRVHKSPPLVPTLSHINQIHTIPSYLSKFNFNSPTTYVFGFPVVSFLLTFSPISFMYSSYAVQHVVEYSKGKGEGKSILETARGGPYICETSRLPHFLDNRVTDGGEVVSLTRGLPIILRKISGTHFCQKLSRPQGYSTSGRVRSIEKWDDLIGNWTRDFSSL